MGGQPDASEPICLWVEELRHVYSVHEPSWLELGFCGALATRLPPSAHVQRRPGLAQSRLEYASFRPELRLLRPKFHTHPWPGNLPRGQRRCLTFLPRDFTFFLSKAIIW